MFKRRRQLEVFVKTASQIDAFDERQFRDKLEWIVRNVAIADTCHLRKVVNVQGCVVRPQHAPFEVDKRWKYQLKIEILEKNV